MQYGGSQRAQLPDHPPKHGRRGILFMEHLWDIAAPALQPSDTIFPTHLMAQHPPSPQNPQDFSGCTFKGNIYNSTWGGPLCGRETHLKVHFVWFLNLFLVTFQCTHPTCAYLVVDHCAIRTVVKCNGGWGGHQRRRAKHLLLLPIQLQRGEMGMWGKWKQKQATEEITHLFHGNPKKNVRSKSEGA